MEMLEESKDTLQELVQMRNRERKSVGMGEYPQRVLAYLRQLYPPSRIEQ
jgi:hypothetical protein